MFPSGRRKPPTASSIANREEREDEQQQHQHLSAARSFSGVSGGSGSGRGSLTSTSRFGGGENNIQKSVSQLDANEDDDEKQHFLVGSSNKRAASSANKLALKAKLAKEETIDEEVSCFRMVVNFFKRKRIFIPIIIISCIAAIYCIPYIEIEPRVPKRIPNIPFNFRDGPLRPASVSQIKYERLFFDQIYGPESVALDSAGNMYMAIEGGFVLYAHMNKSSQHKRTYYDNITSPPPPPASVRFDVGREAGGGGGGSVAPSFNGLDLVKIAELNGIRQIPFEQQKRRTREDGSWRRECQLDEQLYGPNLYSGGNLGGPNPSLANNEIETTNNNNNYYYYNGNNSNDNKFRSNIFLSRCSKPLGVRLSPDESYLYVIDTLSGLYRVSLKVADKPHSTQRLVTKLIDFRNKKHRLLPITQLEPIASQQNLAPTADTSDSNSPITVTRARGYLNISLMAVDDLVIDYGAGTLGGDIIYMTDASQSWPAVSFLYDMLEGRPTGAVLIYDTGSKQLSVLDSNRVAHVRTSALDLTNTTSRLYTTYNMSNDEPYMGIGAPRLDENDVFDDRPLHFPNGLELTDDRQALLIADTVNRRIIKHYVSGARKGTSDLWAWTPNYPDNIRRGYDKHQETYWVAGCGQDMSDKFDVLASLNSWPRLRKYIIKNLYLFGWIIEKFGAHVLRSNSVRDFGYAFKIGHVVTENVCPGMMILQYNSYGDIIRSIHSKEFPNDLFYYSQVNEVIDAKTQEHFLYLSSPSYRYVTKLTLPTDSFDLPTSTLGYT